MFNYVKSLFSMFLRKVYGWFILGWNEMELLNGVLKHLNLAFIVILAKFWKLVNPCQWADQEGAMLINLLPLMTIITMDYAGTVTGN